MFTLALRNLMRRPVRSGLTISGVGLALATLIVLFGFGEGYGRELRKELDGMGMQLMLVPLGCPLDAAGRVLKGRPLEHSLPEEALMAARADPAVAVAAPLLLMTAPRPEAGRTDLWAGIDASAWELKPWWKASRGREWFAGPDSVILGAEAAEVELRAPGDLLHSPESGRTLTVAGVLERSGTSDDSAFFVPLASAQRMFGQPGRLTAIAVRLRDPSLLPEASRRLQMIPGGQVVTLTEMMGTFLNLVGAVRTLLLALAAVAGVAGLLGVFNTMLEAVVERTPEIGLLRALGASRTQVFQLVSLEALLLAVAGAAAALLLSLVLGGAIEAAVRRLTPFPPEQTLLILSPHLVVPWFGGAVIAVLLASLYPAWRAGRVAPAPAMRSE